MSGSAEKACAMDVDAVAEPAATDAADRPSSDAFLIPHPTLTELTEHVKSLEKAVVTKEERYIWRVLGSLPGVRGKLSLRLLAVLITATFKPTNPRCLSLLKTLTQDEDQNLVSPVAPPSPPPPPPPPAPATTKHAKRPRRLTTDEFPQPEICVEVEAYICLLIILYLHDQQNVQAAHATAESVYNNLLRFNRRTLDLLTSRIVFYMCLYSEKLKEPHEYRQTLFTRLKICEQNADHEGVAIVQNLILRQYVRENAFELAEKFSVRQNFPLQASNGQAARYLFYTGRIKAIRLEYTAAFNAFSCALQKAPEHGSVGFRQTATKFLIVVQLLLSEVPDKAIFRHPHMRLCLVPYFALVQSVRAGAIDEFNKVMRQHQEQFLKDETATIILRLRHNVIRSGIRNIGVAYSKISMQNVAKKLQIDSAIEAELMVAKAIRNGLVNGKIDHDKHILITNTDGDVYSSLEPKCVEALRFPPKTYYEDLETAEQRHRREYEELEQAMNDDSDYGLA